MRKSKTVQGGERAEVLNDLYRRLRGLMVRKTELEGEKENEKGQGMVEYALILVLIAIVVIVILTVVGHQVNNIFSNISGPRGTKSPGMGKRGSRTRGSPFC